jgi:hypothetical protein
MAKYKLANAGSPIQSVIDTDTGAYIPNDRGNKDWKAYLVWVDEGNTPDPSDEASFVEDWDNTGRAIRNKILTNCDWTQLVDSPLTVPKKAAWATYRQVLRDLPTTYPTYGNVVWPTEPT